MANGQNDIEDLERLQNNISSDIENARINLNLNLK